MGCASSSRKGLQGFSEEIARKDLSEILPGLYLCSQYCIRSAFLARVGATHVVSVLPREKTVSVPEGLSTLRVPVSDVGYENIEIYFRSASEFIRQGRKKREGKVIVHCAAGKSRSATVVIAYLVHSCGMSVRDAYHHVRKRRRIHPNRGFIQKLLYFEESLVKERKGTERKGSTNFMAEYVIETSLGGIEEAGKQGITIEGMAKALSDCDGNYADALLQLQRTDKAAMNE